MLSTVNPILHIHVEVCIRKICIDRGKPTQVADKKTLHKINYSSTNQTYI